MTVPMCLLAILEDGPSYGLRLKQEFEDRTGGVWPLNVGQVYTTIDRLEREDLVRRLASDERDRQHVFGITPQGRDKLRRWFRTAAEQSPSRDPLVLKLVMAARQPTSTAAVIQAERRGAVQLLQEHTRLKHEATTEDDLGWAFLVDSLIFKAEARVRWLDACEARLSQMQAGADERLAAHANTEEADAEELEQISR